VTGKRVAFAEWKRVSFPSWQEAEYGVQNGWLGYQDVVDLALWRLETVSEVRLEEIELAGKLKDEASSCFDICRFLASTETPVLSRRSILRNWALVQLSVFLPDLRISLGLPDELHEFVDHFEYSPEILPLSHYMTTSCPWPNSGVHVLMQVSKQLVVAQEGFIADPSPNILLDLEFHSDQVVSTLPNDYWLTWIALKHICFPAHILLPMQRVGANRYRCACKVNPKVINPPDLGPTSAFSVVERIVVATGAVLQGAEGADGAKGVSLA
jgi:hypothetical protein